MKEKYEYEQWENAQLRKPPPLPAPAGPQGIPPPIATDVPSVANGLDKAGSAPDGTPSSKRMCKRCQVRKPVVKLTLDDGTVVKACQECAAALGGSEGVQAALGDEGRGGSSKRRSRHDKNDDPRRIRSTPGDAAGSTAPRTPSPLAAADKPERTASSPPEQGKASGWVCCLFVSLLCLY